MMVCDMHVLALIDENVTPGTNLPHLFFIQYLDELSIEPDRNGLDRPFCVHRRFY